MLPHRQIATIHDSRTVHYAAANRSNDYKRAYIIGVTEPISIARLAHVAGLSVPRLHTRFRQEVGQSPGEYMLRAKIERALDLLADTNLPVTDIAYSLSFSSAQYFATAFKRLTRATPTSFRRSLKGLEMT